jgi:hypothetical protein
MSVLPAWKMNTALGSPWASRVRVPVMANDVGVLYTPGVSVVPPSWVGPANVVVGARPAASLYAIVKSDLAPHATASSSWIVPLTTPGGNPVMERVGHVPRSPFMTVGPVLVTPAPASTAKLPAVPNPTGASAAPATLAAMNPLPARMRPTRRSGRLVRRLFRTGRGAEFDLTCSPRGMLGMLHR